MRLPKATFKIKTSIVALLMILCCSLKGVCQNTQDCTYGAQLNKIDHFLDSVTASRWITHYQQYVDSVRKGTAKLDPNLLPSTQESFNRRYIQKILDLAGCIGERIFIGINDDKKMVEILGGIDNCGNTLYISDDEQTLRINNNGGSDVHTLKLTRSGGDKGLVELGTYP